jgi:2-polyprenyl-6-methoxyphenol hydroxylase-like FAD-dependent oxidoreductase
MVRISNSIFHLPQFLTFPLDRGQGLNHCICDITNLLDAIQLSLSGRKTLQAAIKEYDDEIVPRGREEVQCSVENGFMLHDWDKVLSSPVFQNGFHPMTGHDQSFLSEHARAHIGREAEVQGN